MRWIWVMTVLAMFITGFPQATQQETQSADLSKDARLQKPITLWFRIEPLPEVLKAVQKQTGVGFICPDRFRNEKVAVFVENRPAHEVLTRLAEVFRIEWQVEDDRYRMERPSEEIRLEEEARRVMREVRRKALSEYLAMLRRVVSMSDAQRKQRKEALEQKRETQGYENTPYLEIAELSFLDYLLSAKGYWADNDLVMPFLASLPKQETERLLNHHLLAYSTHPAQNVDMIPSAVIERHYSLLEAFVKSLEPERRLGYEYLLKNRPLGMSLCFRVSPITYQIVCQFSISEEDEFEREIREEQCRCEIRYSTIYPGFDESEAQKAPLVQRWIQWAEPSGTLKEWLQMKRPTLNREPFPPNWYPKRIPMGFGWDSNQYVISAKFLELLAWRYGIPVVADSFRTSSIMSSDSDEGYDWLEDLLNDYWLRREGDYLMGRRKYYWGWRLVEPEETVLRALEAKFQQGKDLTMDDYARFAVSLNDRQYNYLLEMTLTYYSLEYSLVIEIPLEPLKQLPFLRFWGTLTSQQRASVLAGESLPLRLLNPVQRKAFAHALEPLFPHPNRLTTAPCTSLCYKSLLEEWHSRIPDESSTTVDSVEQGFSAILSSKKLYRTLWYKSDRTVGGMMQLSDRDDEEFPAIVEEDEEIVRKERYKGDLYLFQFVAPPHIVVRYQFVYFKPVPSNSKPVEQTPNP